MRIPALARVLRMSVLLLPYSVSAVDVDIHIAVPPPPHIVFETEPEVVIVPQTHVAYVPVVTQYDMYRYDKYWYVNQEGYWYRSRSYRGPFKHVQHRHLPHDFVVLPTEYRHHPIKPKGPKHHTKSKNKHKHDHD